MADDIDIGIERQPRGHHLVLLVLLGIPRQKKARVPVGDPYGNRVVIVSRVGVVGRSHNLQLCLPEGVDISHDGVNVVCPVCRKAVLKGRVDLRVRDVVRRQRVRHRCRVQHTDKPRDVVLIIVGRHKVGEFRHAVLLKIADHVGRALPRAAVVEHVLAVGLYQA